MRIVLDTNVLISALGWKGGNEYKIAQKCFNRQITLISAIETMEEFRKVALRPKFGFGVEEIDEFISALIEVCEIIEPKDKFNVVTQDPSDNKFLDAAVSGKADFIISGDKHLLNLKEFKGIKILTPKEFLDYI